MCKCICVDMLHGAPLPEHFSVSIYLAGAGASAGSSCWNEKHHASMTSRLQGRTQTSAAEPPSNVSAPVKALQSMGGAGGGTTAELPVQSWHDATRARTRSSQQYMFIFQRVLNKKCKFYRAVASAVTRQGKVAIARRKAWPCCLRHASYNTLSYRIRYEAGDTCDRGHWVV